MENLFKNFSLQFSYFAASSRSTSISSAEGMTSSRLLNFSQPWNTSHPQGGASATGSAGVIGSSYISRPDGNRPSLLIQELQKERRQREQEIGLNKSVLDGTLSVSLVCFVFVTALVLSHACV